MQKIPENGYELAYNILTDGIDILLDFANFQTSHNNSESDWLELKTSCFHNNKLENNETKDDYLWNCAKSAIGFANSCGGIIIIGITDNGDILGVDEKTTRNIGNFKNKVFDPDKGWNTSKHGLIKTSAISLTSLIECNIFNVKNKIILCTLIKPVPNEYFPIEIAFLGKRIPNEIFIRNSGSYGEVERVQSNKDLEIYKEDRKQKLKWANVWNQYLKYIDKAKQSIELKTKKDTNLQEILKNYEKIERIIDNSPLDAVEEISSSLNIIIIYIIDDINNKIGLKKHRIEYEKDNSIVINAEDWNYIVNNCLPYYYNKEIPAAFVSLNIEEVQRNLKDLKILNNIEKKNIRDLKKIYWIIDEFLSASIDFYVTHGNEYQLEDIRHNLPRQEHTEFVGRDDYIYQLLRFISDFDRRYLLTITGVGGVGKTTLALEIAYLCINKKIELFGFSTHNINIDAIIWTSAKWRELIGNKIHTVTPDITNIEEIMDEVIKILEPDEGKKLLPYKDKKRHTKSLLSKYKTLLVVDNMEAIEDTDLSMFLSKEIPPPSKVIITDRRRPRDGSSLELLTMQEPEAIQMIKEFINRVSIDSKINLSEDNLKRLAKNTGGIPRAIEWTVSLLTHKKYKVDDVLSIISGPSSNILYKYLFDTSYSSISVISKYMLSIFTIFPLSMHGNILSQACNIGNEEAIDSISELLMHTLLREHDPHSNDGSLLNKQFYVEELVYNFIKRQSTSSEEWNIKEIKLKICYAYLDHVGYYFDTEGWPSSEAISWTKNNIDQLKWTINFLYAEKDYQKIISCVLSIGQALTIIGLNSTHFQLTNIALKASERTSASYEDIAKLYIMHLSWNSFLRLDLNNALVYVKHGLRYAEQAENTLLESLGTRTIGLVHKEKGELLEAKQYLERALNLIKLSMPTHELAIAYGSLSSLHRDMDEISLSMEYIDKAINIAYQIKNTDEILSIFYQKRSKLYIQINNLDEAEKWIRKAQKIDKKIFRERGFAYDKLLMALIKEKQNNIKSSFAYIQEAYNIFSSLNSKREVEHAYTRIRNLALNQGMNS